MDRMEIHELSKKNLGHLVPMVMKLFPESVYEKELEHYKRIMDSESEKCYISKMESRFTGFIHLKLRNDYVEGSHSSPVGYVEAVYVEPDFRETGIGKKLVETGEVWAREKGCTEYASDTDINNTHSINFHRNIGFREAGVNVCFIKDL